MFDLEKELGDWREGMLKATQNPESLDELEGHLRDEIEHLSRSGLNIEQSFQGAVAQIGRADALRAEFNKVGTAKADNMNHNRIYTATLWVFAIYNLIIITCAIGFSVMIGRGTWNEPMGRYPAWSLPWLFALTCVYTILIVATLLARRKKSKLGSRLTQVLNWLMLAALPGGTVIGLYGLFFVDKQKPSAA